MLVLAAGVRRSEVLVLFVVLTVLHVRKAPGIVFNAKVRPPHVQAVHVLTRMPDAAAVAALIRFCGLMIATPQDATDSLRRSAWALVDPIVTGTNA